MPTCWCVTAAAPLTVNESRMVYLEANAAILAPLLDLLPAGWGGVLIVVTNPVDPLCTWARRRTGLERAPRARLHAERHAAAAHRDRQGARRGARPACERGRSASTGT